MRHMTVNQTRAFYAYHSPEARAARADAGPRFVKMTGMRVVTVNKTNVRHASHPGTPRSLCHRPVKVVVCEDRASTFTVTCPKCCAAMRTLDEVSQVMKEMSR